MTPARSYVPQRDRRIAKVLHQNLIYYSTLLKLVSAVEMHAELVCFLRRDPLTTEIPLAQYKISLADLMRLSRDDYSTTYQFLMVLNQAPINARIERYGSGGNRLVVRYLMKRFASSFRTNR